MYDRQTLEGSPDENLRVPGGWRRWLIFAILLLVVCAVAAVLNPRKSHAQQRPASLDPVVCKNWENAPNVEVTSLTAQQRANLDKLEKSLSHIVTHVTYKLKIVQCEDDLDEPVVEKKFNLKEGPPKLVSMVVYVTPEILGRYDPDK